MGASCATTAASGVGVMWKTVSNICNMACDYCYFEGYDGKSFEHLRIDSAVLEKFIQEYMSMCGGVASFAWQGGEPLLAGLDFFQLVVSLQAKYAKPGTAISNAIQTNGTLLNEEWAKFFKRYQFLVGVSIDGPKDLHDARRTMGSGAGSYDAVMRGIDALRKEHVDFNVLSVIHEQNVEHARELMAFYEQEQFGFVQFIPCMDFKAKNTAQLGNYAITAAQYGKFLCDAFDIWFNQGNPHISVRFFDNILSVYLNRGAEMCTHRATCPQTLILERNGDAYPCDFYMSEDYRLGNVGVNSLESILRHPTYEKFLALKPDLPAACQSCEYVKLCCGGCPRNRGYSEQGVTSPDVFCTSYKQLYAHADERLKQLAASLRKKWKQDWLKRGNKLPQRNDLCLCGSGLKYKKCCE